MAPAPLTPARRAIGAALLFLLAGALAGVTPLAGSVEYRAFGLVEGIFGLLLCHLFLERGVWSRPGGAAGWIAIAYGTVATAQVVGLLLPPPGLVQWVVVIGLTFTAVAAFAARSPTRLLAALGGVAVLLALLEFSVIPFLWVRAGPGPGQAWGLGGLAEGFRRLFVEYRPLRPGGEMVGFTGLACWCAATRLLWPERRSEGGGVLRPERPVDGVGDETLATQ